MTINKRAFQVGDRVFVNDENHPDFWANGAKGVVARHPSVSAVGNVRMVKAVRGYEPYYWVVLDEARLDGDGDGPYGEAELAAAWLFPVSC